MKVLFIKRNFSPMGGSESLTYQFAIRLAKRGHDVRVVCGQAFDERPRFDVHGVDVVQVRARAKFLGIVGEVADLLFDFVRVEDLEPYAEDRDVIHNIGREYLDSSLLLAERLELPIVLTPLAHPGQFHGGDTAADFARYRRAAAITTMTGWERDWYASHGIDPYRVVTTGMGANAIRSHDGAGFRARRGIPAEAPIILFIGRRERYKGFIHLLDAAEIVWRRFPDTRFVFIGVPGFYGAVIDEFARYADDRIIEIDRASQEEKSAALDASAVYAMPSLHETFGIGYLEAWLHGKPVIGGDIPPLREVIDHGTDGLLVKQNVDDIAGALMELLADGGLRDRMGRAGAAKMAARWNWDAVIDRLEDAYERAASGYVTADEALA